MKKMLWVLPLLLVFGSVSSLAQSTNAGDIRGTVTDTTGALIPDVTVTVTNVDTGVTKTIKSNQAGLYDTDSIVTGNYTVTFTKEGFQRLVRGPITLQLGFTTVNGELKVGSATEAVTVTEDVPLLQTETSEQSTTLTAESMVQLPQVTQDWENFTILLPGATGATGSSQGTANPGQEVAVNGNLPYSNIIADGASTTLSHSQNANPSTFENVAELQVNTSSFSAQYGIGGIIFNQVSKGGTNKFHGTAYDFIQNDAFTAYPYEFGLSKAVIGPIPFLRYNNFGGAIGGPVLKNKMFFYFNYDRTVNHGNQNGKDDLPTDAMIGGDFSGLHIPVNANNPSGMQLIYDPTTQTIGTDSAGNKYPIRQSFLSEYGTNAIPAALFDKVAVNFQKFFPTTANHPAFLNPIPGGLKTGTEGEPQQNWFYNQLVSSPVKRYFGRLDYDVTPTNRITMSDTQADFTYPGISTITTCPVGCQNGYVDNNNAEITDVWNVSSTLVNEFRVGYTNQMNFFTDSSLGKGYAAQLGWQFGKEDDFPGFETTGSYPYSWLTPGTNSIYKEHVFDFSDVVTLIRGKHILHFGGELLAYRDNSTAWGNKNAGTMQYSGQYTRHYYLNGAGVAVPDPTTGFEYADFLLGDVNNWSANVSPEYGARLKSPQFFAQDDFKIRPSLTINLGLRWQINHGWNEIHGNIDSFDPTVPNPGATPPNALGAYWFANTHANGRTALEANVYNTFLPRVGFAWAMRPNTTIRGGFGLYAYNWSLDTYGHGMGGAFGTSGSYGDPTNGIYPATLLSGNGDSIQSSSFYNGPPRDSGTPLPFTAASQDPTRFNGGGADYQLYHAKVPKIYQWNFGVERQLSRNFMAQLAYVGSHGFNLAFPVDLNQVHQANWAPVDSQSRPYPWYQSIYAGGNAGTMNAISNYSSLQASITKRMTSGLSLSFNYVWSHFLDDLDSSGWGSRMGPQDYQNAYDPGANYSNSNFDVRHAFKGYAVYQLPFGRGKPFLNSNRFLDEAVGGWQVSGTVVLQTGNPFSVYGDQANYSLAGTQFPNRNPGVGLYPSNRGIKQWFNPAAFSKPADGTWGDVRRNSLYGPGINVFNMSAAKSFGLPWEDVRIQFRADAQNVFNHPSFGPPGSTSLGGAGGVGLPYSGTTSITSTTINGRTLQLMLRVSF